MKDLVLAFRTELLVYDLEKQNGILFNLPDTLQCGMLGLSAVSSTTLGLWKLIESSIVLLKSQVYSDEYKITIQDSRTDLIDFSEIISRVKMLAKSIINK